MRSLEKVTAPPSGRVQVLQSHTAVLPHPVHKVPETGAVHTVEPVQCRVYLGGHKLKA